MNRPTYVQARVIDQAENYFRPAAARYGRRAKVPRAATIGCSGLATLLGAVAAYLSAAPSLAAWVAVLTTIGGAIVAHLSAQRYDFLIFTCLNTGRRLETLASEWKSGGRRMDQAERNAFVTRCEEIIAATNQSRIAKLGQPASR